MYPNNPQDPSSAPASLPPVPLSGQQQPVQPMMPLQQPASPAVPGQFSARQVLQARQVVEQFRADPYKLSEAFNQLKLAYLAEQYQIRPNSSD